MRKYALDWKNIEKHGTFPFLSSPRSLYARLTRGVISCDQPARKPWFSSKDFSDAVADVGQLPPIVMSLGHGICWNSLRGAAVCQLHVVMREREAGTTHFYRSYTDTLNWLVVWNRIFSFSLGISSSQLTNSMIFQRGRYTTNQPVQFSVWLFWDHRGLKSQLTFSKAKPRMANPFAASKQRSSCGQWAAKRWFRTLSLPQERVISLEPYGLCKILGEHPPALMFDFLFSRYSNRTCRSL